MLLVLVLSIPHSDWFVRCVIGCRSTAFSALILTLPFYFFQAEDGIRDLTVTGVQTCALPISQRHVHYGTEVGRDVLADQAVPARRADGEESLLVRKTHGGAVDLHFERIAGGATLRDEPGVAVFPFGELRLVERVGERQHRHEVAVLLE